MSTTCAIYVRISDDPTGARAGVERQLDECRALAAQRGWSVGEIYEDDDRSAYSGKPRPAWERLLVDLAAGRVGALVAWHPDRLYRRIKDLSALVDAVGSRSVEIVTVSGGAVDLSTPTGRAVAMTICTWAGEFESAHKAERVALAAQARAHRGECPKRRSLGYASNNAIVEREAEAIRAVVPILLDADRASLRAAARKLDDLGITTIETNRSFSTDLASLRSVLTGFKIAGIPSYRGEPLLDVEPNWTPIITRAQHEALRAVLLDDRRRTNAGRPARVALLSGIASCAVCSGPVRSATKEARKGSRDRVPTYRCAQHTHFNIRRAILDEQVVEAVLVELACRDLTALAPSESDRDRMRALRDEMDGVEKRQTEVADLVAEGLLPPSRARQSLEGLRAAHDAAQGELRALSARFGPAAFVARQAALVTDAEHDANADAIADRFAALDLGRQRAIVSALVSVVVDRATSPGPRVVIRSRATGEVIVNSGMQIVEFADPA